MALWFSPWWAGGRVLAPLNILHEMMQPWRGDSEKTPDVRNHMVVDSVTQYLGYRMFAADQFETEGRIGWSSLTYGGTATHANTMALYDDWTMQLHRWLDYWSAWHLGLMGQFLIAGGGMFGFLRQRGIGSWWAVVAALAFAANSQFICWINHRWALGSFCWLPWIFLAMDRWRAGKRAWGYLVPVFLALGFLGGSLQHSGLLVVAVGAYAIAEVARAGGIKPRCGVVGRHALWGLAGVGLAAAMFYPCVEAFLISNRLGLHTGLHQGVEDSWYQGGSLQPWLHLVSYPLHLFPSVLGGSDSIDVLKVFRSNWFYTAYAGFLPGLLGFLALGRKDVPLLARVLVAVGLLLPLTPLVRFLYPRLLILFIFGGLLAFAWFMQHGSGPSKRRVARWTGFAALAAAVMWLAVSLVLAGPGREWLETARGILTERMGESTFAAYEDWTEIRVERFLGRMMIWSSWHWISLAALFGGIGGLWLTGSERSKPRWCGKLLVAAVVLSEVGLFASRGVTWSDPEIHPLYPETGETLALRERVGSEGRVKTVIHPVSHMPKTPLIPNTVVPYGIATIDGYDSIVPDGMRIPSDPDLNARRLAIQGVGHLVAPADVQVDEPGWTLVEESVSTTIYQNAHPAPRYLQFPSRADLNTYLARGEIGAALELNERTGLENSRRIPVTAGEGGWLRIAENHDRDWRWRIAPETGAWRETRRAADGSMMISLAEDPAFHDGGDVIVEMEYRSNARRTGTMISVLTLVMLLVLAVRRVLIKPTAASPAV